MVALQAMVRKAESLTALRAVHRLPDVTQDEDELRIGMPERRDVRA